jgi:methylmalonyl-CoA/ethylmalonyl-CoA epimerase
MLKRVNHIGIAVQDLDKAIEFWNKMFGVQTPTPVTERDMRICMIQLGDLLVELIAPVGTEGVMAKHIEKRGEGIHHVCYEVDDIYKAVEEMSAKGMRFVSKEPREGAEGKVVFLHPSATQGVLTELVQVR